LKQTPSEFFKVDIGEGVQLDGWMMKPPDFDPQKRYPVLFYVYGEPWGQTVLDSWGGRNRAVASDAGAAGLHRDERR
jgi:dipeptidyl-peptidase-4